MGGGGRRPRDTLESVRFFSVSFVPILLVERCLLHRKKGVFLPVRVGEEPEQRWSETPGGLAKER